MTRRGLRKDLDKFAEVYNSAWSENWGFVPYSKEDLDAYALDLQLVYSPEWFMVAEKDGETIAMAITVMDANQLQKRMNGKLLPTGWWDFLRRNHTTDQPPRRLPRRQARVAAHRRRRPPLRRTLRSRRPHPPQTRRGRLHPRDQPRDELRPRSDERPRREEVPRLRTA